MPRPPRVTRRAARPRIPAPTIRLRLTITYGLVFLVSGAVLLTIGYALVHHNVEDDRFRAPLRLAVGSPQRLLLPGAPHNGALRAYLHAVHRQLVSAALHRLLLEYLFGLLAMTLVSVGAGWALAGRALRPLREITATARRVSSRNLGERIALTGPADELRELADTMDGMLARLEQGFVAQRHFVANASHELRTPLAVMRAEIDVALADPGADADELRAAAEGLRETVDRCERLIEGLLVLARSEVAEPLAEPVDLAALAGDCITDLRARADEAEVELRLALGAAPTVGDARLIERLVTNLLDNGIRHNVRGGRLSVATGSRAGGAWLTVANGGPPIGEAELAGLTEPFRRLARTDATAGFGLGLSIARGVCEAHGGRLELAAPAEGGLRVTAWLPETSSRSSPRPAADSALTSGLTVA